MAALAAQGIVSTPMIGGELVTKLEAFVRHYFINELPLLTRVPREQGYSELYGILTYDVRPNSYTLTVAATADTAGTVSTWTLADVSPLMNGDVIEVLNTAGTAFERVEVQGDPVITNTNTGAGTVAVKRGVSSTTTVANDSVANPTLTLIGNSRTGAEVNQTAIRSKRSTIPQAIQTFQFPVEIGGKVNFISALNNGNVVIPAGERDLFSFEEKTKMTEMARDVEKTFYYGLYQAPVNVGDRAKMAGLRQLIGAYNAGANVNLSGGAAFTKQKVVQYLISTAYAGGGVPDLIIASPDVMQAMTIWAGGNQTFFNSPRDSSIGVAVQSFAFPFLPATTEVIPSLQLRSGTMMALTSRDLKIKYLRQEHEILRGVQGDAMLGDMLCDMAIELGHPSWHAYVSGITSYA